eukprot:1144261-Pelagomonas_calceolata.AAC.4
MEGMEAGGGWGGEAAEGPGAKGFCVGARGEVALRGVLPGVVSPRGVCWVLELGVDRGGRGGLPLEGGSWACKPALRNEAHKQGGRGRQWGGLAAGSGQLGVDDGTAQGSTQTRSGRVGVSKDFISSRRGLAAGEGPLSLRASMPKGSIQRECVYVCACACACACARACHRKGVAGCACQRCKKHTPLE